MKSSRETIYQAVFELLTKQLLAGGQLTSASRKFRPMPMIKPGETPILMTVQTSEDPSSLTARNNIALPYAWELRVFAVVYVMAAPADPDFIPATYLNPILDYIESVFPPQTLATPNNPATGYMRNTLGGLPGVYQACLDGKAEFGFADGVIAPNQFMSVPLKIIAL
jgi:hypothetical protein